MYTYYCILYICMLMQTVDRDGRHIDYIAI